MSDELYEKRGNKVVIPIEVRPDFDSGYIAIANGMVSCWSKGATIDEAINKFKAEYGALLKIQFGNGEELEFDFRVKLAG